MVCESQSNIIDTLYMYQMTGYIMSCVSYTGLPEAVIRPYCTLPYSRSFTCPCTGYRYSFNICLRPKWGFTTHILPRPSCSHREQDSSDKRNVGVAETGCLLQGAWPVALPADSQVKTSGVSAVFVPVTHFDLSSTHRCLIVPI